MEGRLGVSDTSWADGWNRETQAVFGWDQPGTNLAFPNPPEYPNVVAT